MFVDFDLNISHGGKLCMLNYRHLCSNQRCILYNCFDHTYSLFQCCTWHILLNWWYSLFLNRNRHHRENKRLNLVLMSFLLHTCNTICFVQIRHWMYWLHNRCICSPRCFLFPLNICPGNKRCTHQYWIPLWRRNTYPPCIWYMTRSSFQNSLHSDCKILLGNLFQNKKNTWMKERRERRRRRDTNNTTQFQFNIDYQFNIH